MTEELRKRIAAAGVALKTMGASEVYLFGSAARDDLRDGSDVDLAIAGLPPEKFFQAMSRAEDALNRPIDLVDLDEHTAFTEFLRAKGKLVRVA